MYFCGVKRKGDEYMNINNEDRVVKEMFRECFGDEEPIGKWCVEAYFSRIREGITKFESFLVPGLGSIAPRYMLSLRRWKKGLLGLRDVELVKRGALRELLDGGYNKEYVERFIEEYGLKEYIDETE